MRNSVLSFLVVGFLAGCKAGGDYQGLEYAPNMYHSVAYEPLTQITDETAGGWVSALENGRGEYFNSNKYNPNRMNMRVPPPNTVKRNKNGWLPYRIPVDQLELAAQIPSPLDSSPAIIAEGKTLFASYCQHCHGATGQGNGLVAEKFAGVANLTGAAYANITEGHIFHVITYGKGLMGPHGSQVSPEDRWKIAKFVKTLQ